MIPMYSMSEKTGTDANTSSTLGSFISSFESWSTGWLFMTFFKYITKLYHIKKQKWMKLSFIGKNLSPYFNN